MLPSITSSNTTMTVACDRAQPWGTCEKCVSSSPHELTSTHDLRVMINLQAHVTYDQLTSTPLARHMHAHDLRVTYKAPLRPSAGTGTCTCESGRTVILLTFEQSPSLQANWRWRQPEGEGERQRMGERQRTGEGREHEGKGQEDAGKRQDG
jgi:hypothetical protein